MIVDLDDLTYSLKSCRGHSHSDFSNGYLKRTPKSAPESNNLSKDKVPVSGLHQEK